MSDVTIGEGVVIGIGSQHTATLLFPPDTSALAKFVVINGYSRYFRVQIITALARLRFPLPFLRLPHDTYRIV